MKIIESYVRKVSTSRSKDAWGKLGKRRPEFRAYCKYETKNGIRGFSFIHHSREEATKYLKQRLNLLGVKSKPEGEISIVVGK